MMNAAIELPTKKQHDSALKGCVEFCELFQKDPLQQSRKRVQEYVCFLCYIKHVRHGAADKKITTLGHLWITNG